MRIDLFGVDALDNMESYAGLTDSKEYHSLAQMRRHTTDTSWLRDVSFDLTVALAPIVSGSNPITPSTNASTRASGLSSAW